MSVDAKVFIGWILLAAGLIIIGQAIDKSGRYFGGKAEFPAVFKTQANPAITEPAVKNPGTGSQQDLQNQMQQAVNQAMGDIVPAESVTKTFNMVAWLAFASFLVLAGGKVAAIGVQLLLARDKQQNS